MAKKKSILDLHKMKQSGEKAVWVTAYDYPMASFAEQAGMDMILVGDSLGMIVYGYDGTVPVTMEDCIIHSKAVRRGAPNTFIIGDMPFGSYHISDGDAVYNACRFLKEANCDAIKLEGGARVASKVKAISDAGIVVFGHIGLTPQSAGQLGGFKAQGLYVDSARSLIKDALAIQEAGALALLLEGVPPELTEFISKKLTIPVYGIGAGIPCDGQVLVLGDLLGMFQNFTPKFAKKYANLAEVVTNAFKEYADDVRCGNFPEEKHVYHIKDSIEDFERLFEEFKES
ncbi:3-methyl-2-oxobutanoate hydroxymethyltransferase [bioreactor metagenome]|uniref:3-methyl-2-oxobutanoate hydroxymethyltransferase n=2 Tax=root TaxID=1 RepID=A0A562J4B5_9FIRM|nr:3-methyl-2-oxobutanoate hydroxymethyltransferase [Sedimentibacter saalensis]MEA5094916.1 3-methyl-2-oxobutanoate hydroxymethyltransferase [Sedimentibacter saalensis]TWH77977.1 ketopantoate hydroxymethyltransferase [Sedimentibacter saalensis]